MTRRELFSLRLTGSIPSTIGQLTALTRLYVFVLTIQCRAHASRFARRYLHNNQLTSSIPSTIGQLTSLRELYVFVLTITVSELIRTQDSFWKPVDKLDSVDDWTIDSTHYIVRVRVDDSVSGAHLSVVARRGLHINQLTSSIPSTIGQLTALTSLYVFVLTITVSELTFLDSQGSFWKPVDKLDSVDDWTIDGTPRIVRVRVDNSVSELTFLASHAGLLPTTSCQARFRRLLGS
jgi:hypothetical protein